MSLNSVYSRHLGKRHVLQFSLIYQNGTALFIDAEIKAKEDVLGKYTLSVYMKNELGQRLAFEQKPDDDYLKRTFGMRYRILQASGYIAKEPEPACVK